MTWRQTEREWSTRMLAEYREMPGLRLTLPQAARLWALEVAYCRAILDALVAAGRLRRSARGEYCLRGEDVTVARRATRRSTRPLPLPLVIS